MLSLLKCLEYSFESAHFIVARVYGAAAYALDIFHTRYDLGLVLVLVARILEPLRTHAQEDFLQRDVFDRVEQCRHDDAIRYGFRRLETHRSYLQMDGFPEVTSAVSVCIVGGNGHCVDLQTGCADKVFE